MSTIKVKVANPLNKQVKQVTVGKVDASSINMNDLANVDTTTVSLQRISKSSYSTIKSDESIKRLIVTLHQCADVFYL